MSADCAASADAEAQLRKACAELGRRLRAGESVCAEEVLAAHREISDNDEAALEVIYSEYAVRVELDQTPDPAAWFARFPRLAERLQRLFEVHQLACAGGMDTTIGKQTTPPPAGSSGDAKPPASEDRLDTYEILEKIDQGGLRVFTKEDGSGKRPAPPAARASSRKRTALRACV